MDGDSSDEERERPNPRQPPMSPINGTASFPSFHSQQFGINLAAHEAISPSLRELCAAHGVQPHDAHLLLSKIDLFQPVDFSLQTLTTFSKLVEVTVIQAPRVTSLAGLSACRNLKKLFVVECSLTSLAGLEELTSLTHLCLDGNSISRIRNECFIGCGHSLQILSLNENRIPRIEGLWRCTRLKELSLARNFISAIGEERSISDGIVNNLSNESSLSTREDDISFLWPLPGYEDGSLSGLSSLTHLQLSGNQISSFNDISQIASQLPSLKHLFLNDPHWGSNPVCSLANYSTFALYLLPKVFSLDAIQITPESRVKAEATYKRKSMHYSMRTRRVRRSLIAVQETAKRVANETITLLSASFPSLNFAIRTLETNILFAEEEINAAFNLVTSTPIPIPIPSLSLNILSHQDGQDSDLNLLQPLSHLTLTTNSIPSNSTTTTPPLVIPLPKSPLLTHCTWPPLRPLAGLATQPPPLLAAAKTKLALLRSILYKREATVFAIRESVAALNIATRSCAAVHAERMDLELSTGRNTRFEEILPLINAGTVTMPLPIPPQISMSQQQLSPVKFPLLINASESLFTACSQFLRSRFTKDPFSLLHVSDIRVTRVVKVNNTQLRTRFEKRVAALLETVPFLKQAMDEFFTPFCDSKPPSSTTTEEGTTSSTSSNSLHSAMALLLGDSGAKTGVDFVLFSPRWSADGISAAASISTPSASVSTSKQSSSIEVKSHGKQSKGYSGGQFSLSMALQDAVGLGTSVGLQTQKIDDNILGSSDNTKTSSIRSKHMKDILSKQRGDFSENSPTSSSSSLRISTDTENESTHKTILRISEVGFSAVDASVATPVPPLLPDYCNVPPPTFASPTLNMRPARNRADVPPSQLIQTLHLKRMGRLSGKTVDETDLPLRPPPGATLLPCLSASTALGIPVTNSLACADLPRLAESIASRLEKRKEYQWTRAAFPDYSLGSLVNSGNKGNEHVTYSNSFDSSRFSSSQTQTRMKNTPEQAYSHYSLSKAERKAMMSWNANDNEQVTNKDKDNKTNTLKKEPVNSTTARLSKLLLQSKLSPSGVFKDSVTSLSSSTSSLLSANIENIQTLDWLKPRVCVPFFSPPDLGPMHWLGCAGIDINSLIHNTVLRKALRANLHIGSQTRHMNSENNIDLVTSSHSSAQQLAAEAASVSIITPAPFSGPSNIVSGSSGLSGLSTTLQSSLRPASNVSTSSMMNGKKDDVLFDHEEEFITSHSSTSSTMSPLASSYNYLRSGKVVICRAFLGNVLDLTSNSNVLEATQSARNLPTSFYGDPLLTPAGQAAATQAHTTSQRLSQPTGKGGNISKKMNGFESHQNNNNNSLGGNKDGSGGSVLSGSHLFSAKAGERLWTVLDPHLLVPEYIVDFSYVFEGEEEVEKEAASAVSTFMSESTSVLSQKDIHSTELVSNSFSNDQQQRKSISSPSKGNNNSSKKGSHSSPSKSTNDRDYVHTHSHNSSCCDRDMEKEEVNEIRLSQSKTNIHRSDITNAFLRLHSLSSPIHSTTSHLSRLERSQLSATSPGQTFQAASAMLRRARSIRGEVVKEGGEATVSTLTVALESIANAISQYRALNKEQYPSESEIESSSSLNQLLSILSSAEDVDLRAIRPYLMSFSKLVIDAGLLLLERSSLLETISMSDFEEKSMSKTHHHHHHLNVLDAAAWTALNLLPRTSHFVPINGIDIESKTNIKKRTWLTSLQSMDLSSLSFSSPLSDKILPISLLPSFFPTQLGSSTTITSKRELASILFKMEPLQMLFSTTPSNALITTVSMSSGSSFFPLNRPFASSSSAAAMSNITSLTLDGCGLSGSLASYGIMSCSGLRHISVSFNQLTSLYGLASCAALREVDASYNLIKTLLVRGETDNNDIIDKKKKKKKSIWSRTKQKHVTSLAHDNEYNDEEETFDDEVFEDFNDNYIESESVLGECKFLEELRISYNLFTQLGDIIIGIQRRPMLRVLDLRGNPLLDPFCNKQHASYLPRILAALPRLGILNECLISESDWRLLDTNALIINRISVLQQPELIAKIAIGGEKALRDAFLFRKKNEDDDEENEEDKNAVDASIDRIQTQDNYTLRIQHLLQQYNEDKLLVVAKEMYESISLSATKLINRYPKLLLSHSLDLSGSFLSHTTIQSKLAVQTLAAMPSLKRLSLSKNTLTSLVPSLHTQTKKERNVANNNDDDDDDDDDETIVQHLTLTALTVATNLSDLDLHGCNLKILAHPTNVIQGMTELFTELSTNHFNYRDPISSIQTSVGTPFDSLGNESISFSFPNPTSHTGVGMNASYSSAAASASSAVSPPRIEFQKRLPKWGYAMTEGAAKIIASIAELVQDPQQTNYNHEGISSSSSSSATSSSSSSATLSFINTDDQHNQYSSSQYIDRDSPFLTPIVIASVNDGEEDIDDEDNLVTQHRQLHSRQGSSGMTRKVTLGIQGQSGGLNRPEGGGSNGINGIGRNSNSPSSENSLTPNSPFTVLHGGQPLDSISPLDISPTYLSSPPTLRFSKLLPLLSLFSPLLAAGNNLCKLDLSYNELDDKAIIDANLHLLPNLSLLSLERNRLETFDGIKGCSGLLELYLSLNNIGANTRGEDSRERRRRRRSDVSSQSYERILGQSISLLASTSSPILRMLRAIASDPVATVSTTSSSEGNTTTTTNRNVNGSGIRTNTMSSLPLLTILDLTGNPITNVKGYKEATLRRARKLRVLDGTSVSAADLAAAGSDRLNGKLTVEWLEDRAAAAADDEEEIECVSTETVTDKNVNNERDTHPLSKTIDLDYASAHIRDVELLSPLSLPRLRSISLDHNHLTDEGIAGLKLLMYSPTLKTLSLNHNKVVTLLPALGRDKANLGTSSGGGGLGLGLAPEDIASTLSMLLPLLAKEHDDWAAIYSKIRDSESRGVRVSGDEGLFLQSIDSRERLDSRDSKTTVVRAGSGGAAAVASILASQEKEVDLSTETSFRQQTPIYLSMTNFNEFVCRLERLYLVHNGIVSMEGLGLSNLPKLREIDLSHNEIAKVSGLAGCKNLASITLNGNVIRALDLVYLSRSCPLLTHLSAADNGLRSLTGTAAVSSSNIHTIGSIGSLRHLLSVNLASNRISDVSELEPLLLCAASSLITTVSFALNPVSRKPNYRSVLLSRLPELLSIDNREVSLEERGLSGNNLSNFIVSGGVGGVGGGGGEIGGGGGLAPPTFLHQQNTTTQQQAIKLFGGQQSSQLSGLQHRLTHSSLPTGPSGLNGPMGPLAQSVVSVLSNLNGGGGGGGGGGQTLVEPIVMERPNPKELKDSKDSTSSSSLYGGTQIIAASQGNSLSSTPRISSTVNIGHDALFGAVINHYKDRQQAANTTSSSSSSSFYVLRAGNGTGGGSGGNIGRNLFPQSLEKNSTSNTSRSSSNEGLSLTAISLLGPPKAGGGGGGTGGDKGIKTTKVKERGGGGGGGGGRK